MSVHQNCIELFMIEIYKYLNGSSSDIINTIFKLRQNTFNLRNFNIFESQNLKTKNLWKHLPEEVKNFFPLPVFKGSMKKVPLISSLCNCYKIYIHLGYIYFFLFD